MFLNRDFCMEKLLAREVPIFLEKIRSFNILLKIHKTTPNCKNSFFTRGPNIWIKLTNLPEFKIFE